MGHSVLPKSTNEARINENFDVFDWSIPEDLFAKFSEIEQASNQLNITFINGASEITTLGFIMAKWHIAVRPRMVNAIY